MAIAAPSSTAALPYHPISNSGIAPDLSTVLVDLERAVAGLQGVVDALVAGSATGGGPTASSGCGCGCGGASGAMAGATGGPPPAGSSSTDGGGAGYWVPTADELAAPTPPHQQHRNRKHGKDVSQSSTVIQGPAPTRFVRPVSGGSITSRFDSQEAGLRTEPHGALDIGVPTGTKIKAAADGRVIEVGYQSGGAGHFVKIQHAGGLTTLYAHQSRTIAKVGQLVQAGDVIGKSGSTGNSTGPHLHFEVKLDGREINPERFL